MCFFAHWTRKKKRAEERIEEGLITMKEAEERDANGKREDV
jgi:hypothetical protein